MFAQPKTADALSPFQESALQRILADDSPGLIAAHGVGTKMLQTLYFLWILSERFLRKQEDN